jgi:RimJ/RimL family protein N-acetyltransferase
MTTLTTSRLLLRPLDLADVDVMHALWTEASVRKYLWDDEIISKELARMAIEASLQSFTQDGFGMWGVTLKATKTLIGFCGVRLHEDTAEKELLYGLSETYWGTGLTTEAAQAVMDYVFAQGITTRLIALANPANVGSCRVAEKVGMHCEREITLNGETLRYYAIKKAED